ncbi:hypothetical protein DV736_g2523, partial [Chaetothyriales sp. CBS 134916]
MGFTLDRRRSTRSRSACSQGEASSPVAKYLFTFLRLLQLIAALVAIGYWASDIHKPRDKRPLKYDRTGWVYSVIVAFIAAITALALLIFTFFIQFLVVAIILVWEWILVILFCAVTGLMCNKVFRDKSEHATEWHHMGVAAGFVCASLILWFITAAIGTVKYLVGRHRAGVSFRHRCRSAT